MNWIRNIALCSAIAASAGAFADTGTSTSTTAADQTGTVATSKASIADSSILPTPKVGLRVGGGTWNEFMLDFGFDVTFKVPLLPVPELRLDGEAWGKPSDFGSERRGNALSIMGVQSFIAGYAGLGLSYYYTNNEGDTKSGIGLKGLVGMNLPHGTYIEAGLILGPTNPPLFFSIGERF